MSLCQTARSLYTGALTCAPLVLVLGCASERDTPESDAALEVAPRAAESAPPVPSAQAPVDTAVPPSDVSSVPAPTCSSFTDAVRSPVTYAAIHISKRGPRTPGGEFTFQKVGNVLQGEVQTERAGVVRRHALQQVRHEAPSDSIFFWYETGGGVQYLYRLHGTCDALRGTARLFVTEENMGGTIVDVVFTLAE